MNKLTPEQQQMVLHWMEANPDVPWHQFVGYVAVHFGVIVTAEELSNFYMEHLLEDWP